MAPPFLPGQFVPPTHLFNPAPFLLELAFTIVAVVFCIIIYLKTKEAYELTGHAGLKYFREAFLFFGLSYVVRLLLSLTMLSSMALHLFLPRELTMFLLILPFGYFSTIGIFYLIFSSARSESKPLLIAGHATAAILPMVSFVTRTPLLLLLVQTLLLVLAMVLSFIGRGQEKKAGRQQKKLTQARALYLLVSALWLINLWIIADRRPAPLGVELLFQAVSLVVFVIVYIKVSKWTS
jgi:hypothetical protein